MALPERRTRVLEGVAPGRIPLDELLASGQPAILRGIARDWPLVRHGLESAGHAIDYLRGFAGEPSAAGQQVVAYTGSPAIRGRFFYDEGLTGLNFTTARMPLGAFLDRLRGTGDVQPAPAQYVGSTDVDGYLPGLRAANDLAFGDGPPARSRPVVSIWIGNRTVAATHFDQSHNIACCMVGRRRFSLFPPDQVANLYPGPLEPTPGGQVVSMVDLAEPDFARYPRFREALAAGEVAELQPGDALFYPALWWHNVEALDAFNAMINYWWTETPEFMDSPQLTLLHALLSLRDRPAGEKAAWRALFDYYVFGDARRAAEHLPVHVHGSLAPMDGTRARRVRALLLARLNR